ncbi:hypothetical protein AAFF_G00068100 [Aldrovandia affinis]|uniref:Uncharacterized protein n=1 Tax=Aldrovandia affinis TaxID=143900 RepID=A0AAD7RZK6_9TELE|nr:hypothetical protein AAFF_G00068100 [Aldrovandia affinis]
MKQGSHRGQPPSLLSPLGPEPLQIPAGLLSRLRLLIPVLISPNRSRKQGLPNARFFSIFLSYRTAANRSSFLSRGACGTTVSTRHVLLLPDNAADAIALPGDNTVMRSNHATGDGLVPHSHGCLSPPHSSTF